MLELNKISDIFNKRLQFTFTHDKIKAMDNYSEGEPIWNR